MPSHYTHFVIASETKRLLPKPIQEKISSPALYYFGAQGADFCFFYRALSVSEKNFGRYLHGKGGYSFFEILKLFASLGTNRSTALSYALGYITHYAGDTTFHPYVYAISGKSPAKHSSVEGAFDHEFKKQYFEDKLPTSVIGEKTGKRDLVYKNIKLTENEKNVLYSVYACAAIEGKRTPLNKPKFLRAVASYRSYTLLSGKTFGKEKRNYLNEEGKVWQTKTADKRTDGAKELFEKAVAEAVALCEEFARSVEEKLPLDKNRFGKNFLTGM